MVWSTSNCIIARDAWPLVQGTRRDNDNQEEMDALPSLASHAAASPAAPTSPTGASPDAQHADASGSSSPAGPSASAATLSAKERKRQHRWEQKNRWMPHYQLKYGVLPVEMGAPRAADGAPAVIKAKCRFCECFGREGVLAGQAAAGLAGGRGGAMDQAFAAPEDEDVAAATGEALGASAGQPPAKRRKKRQTLKVFGPNFRTDNLESHLSREHPAKWKEYERLKDADKQHFFPDPPPTAGALEQAAAAATFASSLGLAIGSTAVLATHHAGSAGMMLLPSQAPRLGGAPSGVPVSAASTSASLAGVRASIAASESAAPIKLLGAVLPDKSAAVIGSAGGNPVGRTAVPATPAILELLNQLLVNRRGKGNAVEATSLVSPSDVAAPGKTSLGAASSSAASSASTLSWQYFVRVDEVLEHKQLALAPLTADPTDATLEIPYPEAILSFVADLFAAGLDIQETLTALVGALRLNPFEPLIRSEPTLELVASAVRYITAINFANLAPLMASVWGCALVLRFDMQHSNGFVDVRVQLPVHDEVHDVHVLAIPLDARRLSAESLSIAVVRALTAMDPLALQRLVGITIDGDPYHMKNYMDVAVWVRRAACAAVGSPDAAFYILHSAPFLLSHVVEELLEICEAEFDFYATLLQVEALATSSSGGQGGIGRMEEMDTVESARSPRLRSVRNNNRQVHWIEVYELCHWCAIHRETLVRLCTEKQQHDEQQRGPSSGQWPTPSNVWWALVFVFRDLLKDILSVYTKCSRHATSFADVQRHLRELVFQLKLKFNIKPSDMDAAADAGDAAMSSMATSHSKPDQSVMNGGGIGGGGRANSASGMDHDGSAAAAVAAAVAEADSFSVEPSDFSYQDFVNAVIHLDMFMYEAFHSKSIENFTDADRATVYQRFNVLLLLLISKLQTVTTVSADSSSSGANNNSSTGSAGGSSNSGASGEVSPLADLRLYGADIPPSTPYELITMNNLTFMELLNSQQARIRAKWSGKVVAMITEDRNRMVAEFAHRGAFYDAVTAFAKQQHQGDVTFRDAWRLSALEFPSLCSFASPFGALLAVSRDHFGAPRSREITWESNLALEALLQSRQLQALATLRKQLDTIV